jgi:hypothetical protein
MKHARAATVSIPDVIYAIKYLRIKTLVSHLTVISLRGVHRSSTEGDGGGPVAGAGWWLSGPY